jgi:hypothetical protein
VLQVYKALKEQQEHKEYKVLLAYKVFKALKV